MCTATPLTIAVDTAGSSSHTAAGLVAFFARRVVEFRADTAAAPLPDIADVAPASLSSFQLCTEADVCRIAMCWQSSVHR